MYSEYNLLRFLFFDSMSFHLILFYFFIYFFFIHLSIFLEIFRGAIPIDEVPQRDNLVRNALEDIAVDSLSKMLCISFSYFLLVT